MTAGHCLRPFSSYDQIRIWATNPDGVLRVIDAWPFDGHGKSNSDPIDYAFLRIAANARGNSPVTETDELCLLGDPADFQTPVLVIARKGSDPVKVHDHAYVWFPFSASDETMKTMRKEVLLRTDRVGTEWFPDSPEKKRDYVDRYLQAFDDAYLRVDTHYEYHAGRGEFSGVKRPLFGMDTDTFHGNSGAPVFSRTEDYPEICIVGVFAGGALDGAPVTEAHFQEHEFATPLSEIIADLRNLPINQGSPSAEQQETRKQLVLSVLAALK